MSILLTREDLVALTGRQQVKRMCDWLTENHWVFVEPTRRGDIPKVDRAYYLQRMSGQSASGQQARRRGPDLSFMAGGR